MQVNIIFIDTENEHTLVKPFLTSVSRMEIPKLFILSPNYTHDEIKFNQNTTTLQEKLQEIRNFADTVATVPFKQPKKTLDYQIQKTTILIHNFGVCEAAKREIDQIYSENQSNFQTLLKEWEVNCNQLMTTYHENNEVINEIPELPIYTSPKTVQEIFFDSCVELKLSISGYVQLFDDAQISEYNKDQNFVDLMTKIGMQMYSLPKPSLFNEIELFTYIFNPYQERKLVDTKPFIRIPEKVDEIEDPKKKKKQPVKKRKEEGFFGADGTILFNKAFKFIVEQSFQKQKSDDLLIQTGPTFQIRNFGKFVKFFQNAEGLPQVSSIGAKEEKQFLTLCKTKFDDNILDQNKFSEVVNVIDKLGQSGDLYVQWLKTNKVITVGDVGETPALRYMNYFQADKTKVTDCRIIENIDKKPPKPAKGMENMVWMCKCVNLFESRTSYLTRILDNTFKTCLLEQSNLLTEVPEQDLSVYNSQLDQISFNEQNNISSIMEALIMQLEAPKTNSEVQAPQPKSRSASAKKIIEKQAKPDKNAPPPPQIPLDELNLFGITQKDMAIFNLTTDYNNSPVQIPELFVKSLFGITPPTKTTFTEINTQISDQGLQIIEINNKTEIAATTFEQTFLEKAQKHDLRLLDYHTEKISQFKSLLKCQIQRQKREEFEQKRTENQEIEPENLELSVQELAIAGNYDEYIEEDINVNQPFDFQSKYFANFCNKYESLSTRNELFSLISDLLAYDQNCDEDTKLFKIRNEEFQKIQMLQNGNELFSLFQNSVPRLFQTVPQFTIWVNNSIVQSTILSNDLLPVPVKILHRFFLPRLSLQSDILTENSQPIFPSQNDKIDISAYSGNFMVFNLYNSNIQETIDSIYGNIQLKRNYHEQISEAELEDLRASFASTASAKSNSRAKSNDKKKKEQPVELQLPEIVPEDQRDKNIYYFNKYVEKQFEGLNFAGLDTKLVTGKVVLALNQLPDFDISVPSIAPHFDFLPAKTQNYRISDISGLGVSFIDNEVSKGGIKHTIFNPNAEVVQIRITPYEFSNFDDITISVPEIQTPEYDITDIISGLSETNPDALVFPELPDTADMNPKQLKQIKDNEAQQLQEHKKRKKRVQELAEAAVKVQESRKEKLNAFVDSKVHYKRATKSRASATIAASNIRIYYDNSEFLMSQKDLQIKADIDKNCLQITKFYKNVRFDQLGELDYTLKNNEQNMLLEVKLHVPQEQHTNYSDIMVSYEINAENVVCSVSVATPKFETLNFELLHQNLNEISLQFCEVAPKSTILSNSGTQFVEEEKNYFAKSAVQRILDDEMANGELFSLDSYHYFPQLHQGSRTFNYYINRTGILRFARFSVHLDQMAFKNLLKSPKEPYSSQDYFYNVIQSIHTTEAQIQAQNPGFYAKQIKSALKGQNAASTLLILPFNISIFHSENDIFNVILTHEEQCDMLRLKKHSATFYYADSFEISCNNENEPIFAISAAEKTPETLNQPTLKDAYSYTLRSPKMYGPGLELRVSEPISPFQTRPRDPCEFQPDRSAILRENEKPAKSLIFFAENSKSPKIEEILNNRIQNLLFTPNFSTQEIAIFLQFSNSESQILSSLVLADEKKQTLTTIFTQNSLKIEQLFLADIDTSLSSLLASLAKFKVPEFLQIRLKRPFVETNLSSLKEFKDVAGRQLSFAQSENSELIQRNLPCPSQVLRSARKVENALKIDFSGRFSAQTNYWATPEGCLFDSQDAENSAYWAKIEANEAVCEQNLNENYHFQKRYVASANVSGNLVKKILANYEKTTLPRKLAQIPQKTLPLHEIKPITRTIRQLDKEAIVSASIQENYALAGFNQEVIEREGGTLRKTKNSSLKPKMECRTLLVQPNSIRLEFSTDEIEEFRTKNKNKSYFTVFYTVFCRNTGRESLHVRWDRNVIMDTSIFNVLIPMKSGGLPAGLGVECCIEFRIKLDIEDGETLDALVLKTEEELISVPISIWIGEKQETIIIDQRPPRSISQMGMDIQNQLKFSQGDLVKTDTIQPEVIEFGNGQEADCQEDIIYDNYDIPEMAEQYNDADVIHNQNYDQEKDIENINTESGNFESFERLDEDMND
ncbi:hypothetical protein SS50377_20865 [Spironucleus salmonicida]|uniref:Uncharacterized protein n=1 Tax=Spironucleus salmonicida TaxID=348837 RepID=V6LIK0_9EUKA|nr:hypothetical protein SS50377_20865 [Spironucleus salmonicida]|eukprot:EST43541.1 hypothetical protein SS50377_16579 [Spironucleus salmonicida]